jgi:hypothetical protein
VNDSAIRLIGEVFLLRGMGDVLMLLVWWWGWGRYDLYFLMVLVSVVRGMRGGGVDIWWRDGGRQMLELALSCKGIQQG